MLQLENKILRWCRQESLLSPGQTVVAGISGGPDSVAMLRALKALQRQLGIILFAAHFDHSVRGPGSASDRRFVEDLCRQLSVPLSWETLAAGHLAGKGNLEAKLRHHRYQFLLREARLKAAVLATGHTLDDQAETVLLRAVRGAGVRGLAGIAAQRTWKGVSIVRPLLSCCRTEVLQYLQELDQPFRLDPTNRDTTLDRNWTRLVLFPQLEHRLNPQAKQALARTAYLLREVEQDLAERAIETLQQLASVENGQLRLAIADVNSLTPALKRQLILEALDRVRGHRRGLTMEHVDAVLGLLDSPSGRSSSLPGCAAAREFEHLVVSTSAAVPPFSYLLKPPGEIRLDEIGKTVSVELLASDPSRQTSQPLVMALRTHTIAIRNRRPGDRMRWRGRDRKLKEIMLDMRIPRGQRDRLVVIQQDTSISAVEQLGVAENFARPEPGQSQIQVTISP